MIGRPPGPAYRRLDRLPTSENNDARVQRSGLRKLQRHPIVVFEQALSASRNDRMNPQSKLVDQGHDELRKDVHPIREAVLVGSGRPGFGEPLVRSASQQKSAARHLREKPCRASGKAKPEEERANRGFPNQMAGFGAQEGASVPLTDPGGGDTIKRSNGRDLNPAAFFLRKPGCPAAFFHL